MIIPFEITRSTHMWNSDNPSSRNYRINTCSWVPKSSDSFWTKVQGWYNTTTFSRTKVIGSILDRCPRMIQSLFILDDRGHRITSRHMPQDDTIPLHSRRSRSLDHFREWCPRMIQSHHVLDDRGHWIYYGQMSRDDTIPLQHHYSPFRGRSFRTTLSLSRKYSNFTQDRGFITT